MAQIMFSVFNHVTIRAMLEMHTNFLSLGQLRDQKTGVKVRRATRRRKGGDGRKFRGEEKTRWMKFESEHFYRKKKEGQKDETEFSKLLTITTASVEFPCCRRMDVSPRSHS